MKYFAVFIIAVSLLAIWAGVIQPNKPAPKPQKPVVIYRTVPAPRSQVDANLDYLARVAERKEVRRRYKITYGEECPY